MRAILLLAFMALSCTPKPPIPPTPPDPFEKVDAGADPSTCAAACERLWQLGCKGGRPTPKGATCLEICRNTVESGIVTWDLSCISSAPSCPAADRCQ